MSYKRHKSFCVYRVRHIQTDLTIYIGKTNSPKGRWHNHCVSKQEHLLQDYMRRNGGCTAYELLPLIWASSEATAYEFEKEVIRWYLPSGALLNRDLGGVGGYTGLASMAQKERWARLTKDQRKEILRPLHDAARGVSFTEARRAAISRGLYRFHEAHPEVGLQVGLRRTGQRHTAEAKRKMGEARRSLTQAQAQRVLALREVGVSMKEIAGTLGVSTKAIFNVTHGLGVYGQED